MNIGDLWDTIVLRDILGYIVPGTVTLVSLALVATRLEWTWWEVLINTVVPPSGWSEYRWLLPAVVVPLSYVVGNVQSGALEMMERLLDYCGTPWSGENLVIRALKRDERGNQYRKAASRYFGRSGKTAKEPLWHLWRLCDYYVFHNAPDIHRVFVGRYNVLYVLFGNLALSVLILGFGVLIFIAPSGQDPDQIRAMVPLLGVLAVIFPILIVRACSYRNQFVRRAFPVFYTLTVSEGRSTLKAGASPMSRTSAEVADLQSRERSGEEGD